MYTYRIFYKRIGERIKRMEEGCEVMQQKRRSDQFMLIGILHQANYTAGICFSKYIFPVCFYCSFANEEGFSDLPVIIFFFYEANNLHFSVGKMNDRIFFFLQLTLFEGRQALLH